MRKLNKLACGALACAMALSMAVPAFAETTVSTADPTCNVLGRYMADTSGEPTDPGDHVISVGTTWSKEMKFTYAEVTHKSDWDPETLTYKTITTDPGTWRADTDNNIAVSNRSNTDVKVDFEWASDAGYEAIKVGVSETGFTLASAVGKTEETLDSKTVVANVTEGTLDDTHTEYEKMGALTVKVAAVTASTEP